MDELQSLIAAQKETIAALKKRLAGVEALLYQGQQEHQALVADVIKEIGKLEGMQAAFALQNVVSVHASDATP